MAEIIPIDRNKKCQHPSLAVHQLPNGTVDTLCPTCLQQWHYGSMNDASASIAAQQKIHQGIVNAQLDAVNMGMNPVHIRRPPSTNPFWQANTTYERGSHIYTFDGELWQAAVYGTTGLQEPNWTDRGGVKIDGTIVWECPDRVLRASNSPIRVTSHTTTAIQQQVTLTVTIDTRPRRFNWDA